jgi:hypothetical protein
MRQRFVVALRNPEPEQRNTLTFFFKNQEYGFWHWIPDTWFIVLPTNVDQTAQSLREQIRELLPGVHFMVVGIDQPSGGKRNWAGFGPKRWFEWFHRNWDV